MNNKLLLALLVSFFAFVVHTNRTNPSRVTTNTSNVEIETALSIEGDAPDLEDEMLEEWTLYETKHKTLGHIVLIYGPVEEGEVTLSWSAVGYREQIVPIEKYSGSEVYFKPSMGDIARLEDVYWEHNGKRINMLIADACKREDKMLCVFKGGVSIVMSESDLAMMQIDRTLVIKWSDIYGEHHTSRVLLGDKSHDFNDRIQRLMMNTDNGTMHPFPYGST